MGLDMSEEAVSERKRRLLKKRKRTMLEFLMAFSEDENYKTILPNSSVEAAIKFIKNEMWGKRIL